MQEIKTTPPPPKLLFNILQSTKPAQELHFVTSKSKGCNLILSIMWPKFFKCKVGNFIKSKNFGRDTGGREGRPSRPWKPARPRNYIYTFKNNSPSPQNGCLIFCRVQNRPRNYLFIGKAWWLGEVKFG